APARSVPARSPGASPPPARTAGWGQERALRPGRSPPRGRKRAASRRRRGSSPDPPLADRATRPVRGLLSWPWPLRPAGGSRRRDAGAREGTPPAAVARQQSLAASRACGSASPPALPALALPLVPASTRPAALVGPGHRLCTTETQRYGDEKKRTARESPAPVPHWHWRAHRAASVIFQRFSLPAP